MSRILRAAAMAGLLVGGVPVARGLDCTSVSGNLVPACGVADVTEASSWVSNGSGATLGYSATGNPPGSLAADALMGIDESDYNAGAATPCFEVLPSTEYSTGLEVRLESGTGPITCRVGLQYYSDGACGSPTTGQALSGSVGVDAASWTLVSGTGTSDPAARSARVSAACGGPGDFVALFDNAVARPGSTVPVTLRGYGVD